MKTGPGCGLLTGGLALVWCLADTRTALITTLMTIGGVAMGAIVAMLAEEAKKK